MAEVYPSIVHRIVDAGHEIASHSYSHTPLNKLTQEEEERELTQAREILEGFGIRVAGFRAPWEISEHTMSLLDKNDYIYSSNMMDNIKPYRYPGTTLIELPIQWLTEDWAHFGYGQDVLTKKIATNSEVREIWGDEFKGIYSFGGLFNLNLHPQVIGRPSRLNMLDEFITFIKSHDSVWIASCLEIAEYVNNTLP